MTKLPRECVKRLQGEVAAMREIEEPSVIGAGGGLSPMPNVDDLSIVLDFVTEEAGLTVETEADPDQRHHAERALAAANRLRGIVAAPTGSEAR